MALTSELIFRKVQEGMPEERKVVLVHIEGRPEDERWALAYYDGSKWCLEVPFLVLSGVERHFGHSVPLLDEIIGLRDCRVTHWAPLPLEQVLEE